MGPRLGRCIADTCVNVTAETQVQLILSSVRALMSHSLSPKDLLNSSDCPLTLAFKDSYLLFRETGREKERERKHQCVVASRAPPTGDLARNPGMCPDWELNWRPFGLQASAQSTEPHPARVSPFASRLSAP